jgi:hypothetical protein
VSNDTMPCGCEGHMDNVGLCRYPALEAEVARLRQQREEDAETVRKAIDERRRAEGDNAALLGALQDSRDPHSSGDCDTRTCHCGLLEAMDKNHPGAALLERLSAAQSELDALRVAVNATPSGAERIHAMLVAAGIPEEDEVSGVLGLEEHVGRTLERLGVATAYAATGLREHHGHRCGMAGGPYPESAAECEDAHCRQWAYDLDALKERKP